MINQEIVAFISRVPQDDAENSNDDGVADALISGIIIIDDDDASFCKRRYMTMDSHLFPNSSMATTTNTNKNHDDTRTNIHNTNNWKRNRTNTLGHL